MMLPNEELMLRSGMEIFKKMLFAPLFDLSNAEKKPSSVMLDDGFRISFNDDGWVNRYRSINS